jgi:hypothetical protein
MASIEPGNKKVFGSPSPNSTPSREDEIISKTKSLAFPGEAIISHENFEHKGDRPAGSQNTVADMAPTQEQNISMSPTQFKEMMQSMLQTIVSATMQQSNSQKLQAKQKMPAGPIQTGKNMA